jgi:hypothetical protein
MNMIEVELNDAQVAELEAAKGNPDAVETVLARFIDEATGVREQTGREVALEALRGVADKLRNSLMRDTLQCAHFLMHEDRFEEVMLLLCPVVALIEGDRVPQDVFNKMMGLMDRINTEREKHSCEGNA